MKLKTSSETSTQAPREMANVGMGSTEVGLDFKWTGVTSRFTKYRLSCKNLQVFLEARLRPMKRAVRFWFDGQHVIPKFGDRGRVLRFDRFTGGLFVHTQEGNKVIATRIDSPRQSLRLKAELFERTQLMEKIKLIAKPDHDEGRYVFEADPSLYEYVYSRLVGDRGRLNYNGEKGRISEEICSCILAKAGWEEIRRHPSETGKNILQVNRHGPDSLQRFSASGQQYLFEFRWWANVRHALRTAELQARRRHKEGYADGKVKGAYIGILDWDRRRRQGTLRVRKVWSRGE